MPTNEIARSSTLYVLVADAAADSDDGLDYRSLVPDGNLQWGFVQKSEILEAALRLQPWDLIIVDHSMLDAIPNDLLAAADIAEDGHHIVLLLDQADVDPVHDRGFFDMCGYLLKGAPLRSSLARLLRRALYVQSLRQERHHLENEIERILNGWEQSIRDRTRNLERKNQELEQIDELKTQFLENISHELRTPLTLVRSYVEILLGMPPESDEERQEFLSIIDSETRRLSRMIDDLLDLARISAGSMIWNMSEIDLHSLTSEVVGQLRALLAKHDIDCDLGIGADTPSVWGDGERIAQVLMNLIDNAIKHTPGGSIEISADLVSEVDDTGDDVRDMARVRVSDNGTGIPEDKLESIFERFVQADARERTRGAGLGLPICREIVHHHGGRIWATNNDERGASLWFTLPLTGHLDVISGTYGADDGGDAT